MLTASRTQAYLLAFLFTTCSSHPSESLHGGFGFRHGGGFGRFGPFPMSGAFPVAAPFPMLPPPPISAPMPFGGSMGGMGMPMPMGAMGGMGGMSGAMPMGGMGGADQGMAMGGMPMGTGNVNGQGLGNLQPAQFNNGGNQVVGAPSGNASASASASANAGNLSAPQTGQQMLAQFQTNMQPNMPMNNASAAASASAAPSMPAAPMALVQSQQFDVQAPPMSAQGDANAQAQASAGMQAPPLMAQPQQFVSQAPPLMAQPQQFATQAPPMSAQGNANAQAQAFAGMQAPPLMAQPQQFVAQTLPMPAQGNTNAQAQASASTQAPPLMAPPPQFNVQAPIAPPQGQGLVTSGPRIPQSMSASQGQTRFDDNLQGLGIDDGSTSQPPPPQMPPQSQPAPPQAPQDDIGALQPSRGGRTLMVKGSSRTTENYSIQKSGSKTSESQYEVMGTWDSSDVEKRAGRYENGRLVFSPLQQNVSFAVPVAQQSLIGPSSVGYQCTAGFFQKSLNAGACGYVAPNSNIVSLPIKFLPNACNRCVAIKSGNTYIKAVVAEGCVDCGDSLKVIKLATDLCAPLGVTPNTSLMIDWDFVEC